jgi:hypothetical protein
MVVANFFDSPVNDLNDFGTNRFDQLSVAWPRAMEIRFRDPAPGVSSEHPEIAATVWHQGEAGFIVPPHLLTSLKARAGRIQHYGILVEADHHSFDIVVVERVKVALDQLFLGGHGVASNQNVLLNCRSSRMIRP